MLSSLRQVMDIPGMKRPYVIVFLWIAILASCHIATASFRLHSFSSFHVLLLYVQMDHCS